MLHEPTPLSSQPVHEIRFLHDVRIPARDGIRFSANLFLPRGRGSFPTIVLRTPYESSSDRHLKWGVWWARRGYAASSARDTDVVVKLIDVFPDGWAMNLADGIIRARYRKSLEKTELLEPGEVAEYKIKLCVTSNVFKKGHRIRLDVTSSNFPRFSRNLNTGEDVATGTRLQIAKQTVVTFRAIANYRCDRCIRTPFVVDGSR